GHGPGSPRAGVAATRRPCGRSPVGAKAVRKPECRRRPWARDRRRMALDEAARLSGWPGRREGHPGEPGRLPKDSLSSTPYPGRSGMGTYFSEREFAQVEPAESAFRSPIPTQVISNGEFNPPGQTPEQKQVEARIKELADTYGTKLGMDRRRFLQTASGMAAAFVAMNNVFGKVFDVSEAEAADPMVAQARAEGTKGQFIMDVQTHWVRDDYNQAGFVDFLKDVNKLERSGLDPSKITVYDVKFENFVRQIYLNSDTSVAILSGAPFDDRSWEV